MHRALRSLHLSQLTSALFRGADPSALSRRGGISSDECAFDMRRGKFQRNRGKTQRSSSEDLQFHDSESLFRRQWRSLKDILSLVRRSVLRGKGSHAYNVERCAGGFGKMKHV
jgi:hypothetical protein